MWTTKWYPVPAALIAVVVNSTVEMRNNSTTNTRRSKRYIYCHSVKLTRLLRDKFKFYKLTDFNVIVICGILARSMNVSVIDLVSHDAFINAPCLLTPVLSPMPNSLWPNSLLSVDED